MEKSLELSPEGTKHPYSIIPVTEWPKRYGFPTLRALRHIIFHADENGFSRVIRRIGRRVYLVENEFFQWLEEHK